MNEFVDNGLQDIFIERRDWSKRSALGKSPMVSKDNRTTHKNFIMSFYRIGNRRAEAGCYKRAGAGYCDSGSAGRNAEASGRKTRCRNGSLCRGKNKIMLAVA